MPELPRHGCARDWRWGLLAAVLFAALFVLLLFRVIEPWAAAELLGEPA